MIEKLMGWTSSIKVKLLLFTVTVVALCLSLQTWLSVKAFREDKTAFVLESVLAGARSTALVARAEIDASRVRLQNAGAGQGTGLRWQREYRYDGTSGRFTAAGNDDLPAKQKEIVDQVVQRASQFETALAADPLDPTGWFLSLVKPAVDQALGSVVVGAFDAGGLLSSLAQKNVFNVYLVESAGRVVMQPGKPNFPVAIEKLEADLKAIIAKSDKLTAFVKDLNVGDRKYLAALSPVGRGGLWTLAVTPDDVAMQAVKVMTLQSAALFAILMGAALMLAVVGAAGLSFKLKQVTGAVAALTGGNLNASLDIHSRDEVGTLATGFNYMVGRIRALLVETADKARMEEELKIAGAVQSTLFPEGTFEDVSVSLVGNCEPASECGGDFWYHASVNGKFYFIQGDATGHGVPAALVTSAARSAVSALRTMSVSSLEQTTDVLSRAIYDVSRGRIMMTGFVLEYDPASRKLTYVKASHEAPVCLRAAVEKHDKKNLELVLGNNGPRFGDRVGHVYETTVMEMQPGDLLFVYTDGLSDLQNNEGAILGERKMLKLICDLRNKKLDLKSAGSELLRSIRDYRQTTPLPDDVTWAMIEFK